MILWHKKKSQPLGLALLSMYPAPESNRHGFPSVFETDASTNSASWALLFSGTQIYLNYREFATHIFVGNKRL